MNQAHMWGIVIRNKIKLQPGKLMEGYNKVNKVAYYSGVQFNGFCPLSFPDPHSHKAKKFHYAALNSSNFCPTK